jgi:asparagine synthase (glutamine-hydrolysing)
MCGIAGIVAPADVGPDRADALGQMLGAIRHRGPDDEGRLVVGPVAIGMRRLSILDPTPAGHQPMCSPDGRHAIVYNGEIYNFLELRRELEAGGARFTTDTDTEVILAAYAAWGASCTARFNGIWAFAIWDTRDETLFLSRDRFGVKPLFVAEVGGRLAFCSEIKGLLTAPWVSGEPDAGVVRDFLVDNLVDHSDRTFFAAIRRVPAAHNVVRTRDGRLQTTRYWGPPALNEDATLRPHSGDKARIEEIRQLLIDAVALELRSDVPIGSCLSGGVDSSSIVATAAALRDGRVDLGLTHIRARERAPQLAFFAEFHDEGIDERRFVDEVVTRTAADLRTVTPSAADFRSSLSAIVRAQDEPFLSTSIVAQYHVMRIANEAGIKVLLDGQGADETFGGYPHYVPMAMGGAVGSGDAVALRSVLRAVGRRRSLVPQFAGHLVLGGRAVPRRLRRDRLPDAWLGARLRAADGAGPTPEEIGPGTVLARGLWRQIASEHLPSLLRYEDRNSMAFGIEARVPFLDHRLVEAALLMPDRLKLTPDGERKVGLRRAVRGLVPDEILDRTDKVAFQTPERRWLLEACLPETTPLATDRGFLAPQALADALARLRTEPQSGSHAAWRMLSIELWLRGLSDATAS